MQITWTITATAILAPTPFCRAADDCAKWNDLYKSANRIAVGHLVSVTTSQSNDPVYKTVATGVLRVSWWIKGPTSAQDAQIDVALRFKTSVTISAESEDQVWVLREIQTDGRRLITDWPWGIVMVPQFRAAAFRIEKSVRVPGITESGRMADISLGLGIDTGRGTATKRGQIAVGQPVRLYLQIENKGQVRRVFTPPTGPLLDKQMLSEYVIEAETNTGEPLLVSTSPGGLKQMPLKPCELIELDTGEIMRVALTAYTGHLKPGHYRLNARYTCHDIDKNKLSPAGDTVAIDSINKKLKLAWYGTIRSNTVDISICN